MRAISAASILALPDTGFVLSAEGLDSSGNEPMLWFQRYDALAKPVGEPWLRASLSSLGAPELARREKGCWTAVWNGYQDDQPEVAWQSFWP